MNTYLGLDVGDRRIGVAISRLGTMAMPLEVISRDGAEWNRIAALATEHEAAAIVAGMTLQPGWHGEATGRKGSNVFRGTGAAHLHPGGNGG